MFPFACILATLVAPFIVSALPQTAPRPLVVWHGLGDSYASPGMLEFAELLKEQHPGLFVHNIYIDEDNEEDKKAGFYGYVNDQVALVADQIAEIPELQNGFDAIGFSQGGQFLRGTYWSPSTGFQRNSDYSSRTSIRADIQFPTRS